MPYLSQNSLASLLDAVAIVPDKVWKFDNVDGPGLTSAAIDNNLICSYSV